MTSSVETRKKSDQDKCFLKINVILCFFDELGFAEILVKEIVNAFTDSKIYLICPIFVIHYIMLQTAGIIKHC